MPKRHFKQTTLLTCFCLSLLCGLAAARRLNFDSWPLVIIGTLLAAGLWPKKDIAALTMILLLGIIIGLSRGTGYMQKLVVYQRLVYHPVTLQVSASSDAVYGNKGQLSFDASSVHLLKPFVQDLSGSLKINGIGTSMVYRGDRLEVQGQLSPTLGAAQGRMSFAKLHIIGRDTNWLDVLRRKFTNGLTSSLPEPEASFGLGLLIGQRSTIPVETNKQLSATGLTHLVAVSGYNLTIIIMAARRLLGKASKFQSTAVALTLILSFVLLTGLSASIVRAAMVSMLSLMAWYYGRSVKPVLQISLAAAATAWWKPFYLWSDIGWYLSFLAFFGVLLLAPLVAEILVPADRGPPKMLPALLAETISAQALTTPIILYIFSRLSVIGLVANVLVVPFVPLAMLLCMLAGGAGMAFPALAGWLSWPARYLLTYMLEITGVLSRLPHASVQTALSLTGLLISYIGLLVLILLLGRRRRSANLPKYGTITDKKGEYVRT